VIALADIEKARERIRGDIVLTPCRYSGALSKLTGCEVHLKLENLQLTGSFKERGALNRLLLLTPAERARGVISASAGNHAQGVAYHAGRLGIPATICMPEGTPLIKVTSTRNFGAQVVLHGANYDEAYEEALRIQQREGIVFVHPFDDDAVIAGQGTVGLELLEQLPDVELVYL
jgi:threonine dehydratase